MLKIYKLESHFENYLSNGNSKKSNNKLQELLKCPGAVFQGINTHAYLCRLELYVEEFQWKDAEYRTKCALKALIELLEDWMPIVL